MPTLTEYYIDATNLSLATCVFTDLALTTVAPQGYYADGAIVRYLTVQGVAPNQYGTLSGAVNNNGQGPLDCPSCVTPCSSVDSSQAIRIESNAIYPPVVPLGTDLSGTYRIPINLGEGAGTTGAVIVRVYFRNQYGAGCGLVLDDEDAFGNITISTNNFSASGSTPNLAPAPIQNFPYLGAPDGGYQRNLTYQPPDGAGFNYGGDQTSGLGVPGYGLVDDTKFLYVGGVGVFGAGPPPTLTGIYYSPFIAPACTALDFLQVPNNQPNYDAYSPVGCTDCPGEFVPAPSIPVIANPQVHAAQPTWTWVYSAVANEYIWQAGPTADITVTRDQVQLSTLTKNTNYSDLEGGYRGWYTAVLPKSNPSMTQAMMKLQSLACGASGNNGFSVVINVNCPRTLNFFGYPILAAQPQTMCTEPQDTQVDAFINGDMSAQIFHVPGAQGLSPNNPQFAPLTEYTEGVPNRWDLVFWNSDGSDPVNPTQANGACPPKWVKYRDANGDPKLFEVTHGIITQTDVAYVPEPAACGEIIKTQPNVIGGGIYIAEAATGAATGAIIVRVFTGKNPKGLYTKLIGADGTTIVTRNNSFSVRGATNSAGDLTQAQYEENSDSATIALVGAIEGGSGYVTGNGESLTEVTVYDASSSGPGTGFDTRSVLYYDNACEDSGEGVWGQLVYGEVADVYTQYGVLQNEGIGGGDLFLFEVPIWIGATNTNDDPESAIPCVSFVPPNLVVSPACPVGFAPEGISGGIYNPLGNINLPDNGLNHTYAGPAAPDDSGPVWNQCTIELGDDNNVIYSLFTYPSTTTGCNDECRYPMWLYDGSIGQYIESSVYYQIGVSQPQVQLYKKNVGGGSHGAPGWTMAVIPKLTADEQKIRVEVTSITSNTQFTARIDCPTALEVINTGLAYKADSLNGGTSNSLANMCATGPPATNPGEACYIAHNAFGGDNGMGIATEAPCVPGEVGTGTCATAGAMTSNIPYLNDMVFKDANGENTLDAGYYYFVLPAGPPHGWFYVDIYGVVTCIKSFPNPCGPLTPCGG